MGEISALFKSLKKIKPEVAAEMEYQVDKNLMRNHPGLMNSSAQWYGGKMTSYLNEVTKNDSSQYAIAMLEPDELAKMIGRANMEDRAVRDRVMTLYNKAASSTEGLGSIVKLDGLVNEKGFIDVTRVTPGSQETAEALRLIERDLPEDMPVPRIPVLVHASGAKWATDPAPRLRYNGQVSGTLSMPKWDAVRPPPITKTVADAASPTFYTDQPKTLEAARSKLEAIYDPAASLTQGEVLKRLMSANPISEFSDRIRGTKPPPVQYVREASDYTDIRRRRMREYLDPLINQYGRDYVKSLAGNDNILTMKLLGERGPGAEDPIVLMRTERYGMTPIKEGEFSPALSSPRETGMHVGEPITARAFQGNNIYHDAQVAREELKTAKPGTPEYKAANVALGKYEERVKTLKENIANYTAKVPQGKLEGILYDSIKEAKENLMKGLGKGQRTALNINSQGRELLKQSLTTRLSQYDVPQASISNTADNLLDYVGITEGTGTTSKAFMLRNVKRPLFLVDTGNFAPSNVIRQLADMPEFSAGAAKLLKRESSLSNEDFAREIHKLIESRGYDSAVYINASSEGNLGKYAAIGGKNEPQGYSPSYMIWKEDQIVPLDDPKAFPNRGDTQLKKALAGLFIAPAATKTIKDDSSEPTK